jgi:uncharacterized RDD family membrane protein YckC
MSAAATSQRETKQSAGHSTAQLAGLRRRFGAMVSDGLVVTGLMVLVTFLVAPPLLSILHKKAIVPSEVGWGWTLAYWLLMLSVWAGYFWWLWARTGQTVGLRAWRLRLVSSDGRVMTPAKALRRIGYVFLPWFPGYLAISLASLWALVWLKWLAWVLFFLAALAYFRGLVRPDKLTWHDKMSGGAVILLPKP